MIENNTSRLPFRLMVLFWIGSVCAVGSAQGIHQVAPMPSGPQGPVSTASNGAETFPSVNSARSTTPHPPSHSPVTAPSPSRERAPKPDPEAKPDAGEATGFPSLLGPNTRDGSSDESGTTSFSGPLITTTASLMVVLGVFAGLVWVSRKYGSKPGGNGKLPESAVRVLGSKQLDPRNRILMLRCGDRVLVVGESNQGMQTLTEIVAPDEVEQLTETCLGESIPVSRWSRDEPETAPPNASRHPMPVRYA